MFYVQIGGLEKNVRFELLTDTFRLLAKKIPKRIDNMPKAKVDIRNENEIQSNDRFGLKNMYYSEFL